MMVKQQSLNGLRGLPGGEIFARMPQARGHPMRAFSLHVGKPLQYKTFSYGQTTADDLLYS